MVRDARGRRFARRARSLFARPRGRINLREPRRLDFFSGAFQNAFIIPKGMKIAVTSQNGSVFQHFGRAPEFAVFDAEDGKITGAEVISCGGSGHGALAGLLGDKKIDVLICGGHRGWRGSRPVGTWHKSCRRGFGRRPQVRRGLPRGKA